MRKFLSEELLAPNMYSKVSITEDMHSHHDEMKTITEYKKRKHMITQDEDKQTEEIELRKSRKSSVKVFKHRYEQTLNTVMEMKELRK